MVEINNPDRERLSPEGGAERKAPSKGPEDRQKLDEHKQELAQGIEGVVEGIEESEGMSTGEVAERSGEDKRKASGARGSGSDDTKSTTQIKNDEPPFEVMVIQVRTQLKKEIAVLEKEAKKYKNSPYQFAVIMQRIRRLRDMLADLAYAAGEKVKSLWKEYVKGS